MTRPLENFFRYDGLREFLDYLAANARVIRLCDFDHRPCVLLRHDVDLCLEMAFTVSRMELAAGISASYFINLNSYTFNTATPRNRTLLRRLVADNFEVGLHFDPTLYPASTATQLLPYAKAEAAYLETLSGYPVTSVSLHQPSVHGTLPILDGFMNAYDPLIFEDERYLSDSCMSFRGKDPFDFVKQAASSVLQILLHPMHFSESGDDFPEMTFHYLERYVSMLEESELAKNRRAKDVMPGGVSSVVRLTRGTPSA